MIPKTMTIIAVGVSMLASFTAGAGVGWKFVGFPRGYEAGMKEAQVLNDALNKVAVDTMRGKIQCTDQVAKVNTEVDRQREENRQILIVDREATKRAIASAEEAARAAAASAQKTQLQITEARDEMFKIKDACVNAGVPADFFVVLNRALAAEADPIRAD